MLGKAISVSLEKRNIAFIAPTRKELDLRNFESVSVFLKKNQVSKVIHCAAKVGGIKANKENPGDFILDNLQIDSSVLKASQKNQITELLYMSSSCTYPIASIQPFKEDDIAFGKFEETNKSYAIAKMTSLEAISAINQQYNLNYKSLILSNLYGPNDNFSDENSHLVSAALKKCYEAKLKGDETVEIWGSGKPRREFTYVSDVAEWISEIIARLRVLPERLNIGLGKDYSVSEYYEFAAKAVGFKGEFKFNTSMPDGILTKLMDSSIAMSKYGWHPTTAVDQGIDLTYKWWRNSI